MTTLPAVRTASELSANEFEVGYIAKDGTPRTEGTHA